MDQLREVTLEEATRQLPDITALSPDIVQGADPDTVFLCALGFEDRCLSVPQMLADSGYRAKQAIVFEYDTNKGDNETYRRDLESCVRGMSDDQATVRVQAMDFPEKLAGVLEAVLSSCSSSRRPSITFDMSACCSRGILETLAALFDYDISLRITYSEAAIYHPTKEEFEERPDDWLTDTGSGMVRGVVEIWESAVYPGRNPDHLPNLLVAFPTFKAERTQKLMSSSEAQVAETVYILGVPHLPEDRWRLDAMRQINKLTEEVECHELSTFDYLDTLRELEKIYQKYQETHHMMISPLGSKLQDVAIALFLQLHPDVSVWFSRPKEFNPKQYTEEMLSLWRIDFGDVRSAINDLRSYGKLYIIPPN